MLTENQKFHDFTGVSKFHAAGYTGSRVTCASGERFSISAVESLGFKAIAPVPNYPSDETDHSADTIPFHPLRTALSFFEVAPDATLAMFPFAKSPYQVAGATKYVDFMPDAVNAIKELNILGMFVSMENSGYGATSPTVDSVLGTLPNFFYGVSAGNQGSTSANSAMNLRNIYGVGAYTLSDGVPNPAWFSSESEDVDWAAPSGFYVKTPTGIEKLSGTSFSVPYQLGMVALIQDFFIDKTGKPITRESMYQFKADHSLDVWLAGEDVKTGLGAVILPDPKDIDILKYSGEKMNIIEETYAWAYDLVERKETKYLVLHHAAATGETAQDIHYYHLRQGWSGIAYHYYIRKDGSIYRGRPENTSGAHTEDYNHNSIGICFEGNYETETTMPDAQLKAGQALIADMRTRYPSVEIKKHSDLNATACPGKYFPYDKITGDETMTGEEIYTKLNEYLKTLPAPEWAKAELALAVTEGITDGTSPMTMIPRYQAALMAYRASK